MISILEIFIKPVLITELILQASDEHDRIKEEKKLYLKSHTYFIEIGPPPNRIN